jgi:hypothetical protein
MSQLKTLATCKPSEFLRQTNRIKKSVEKWLNVAGIKELRSHAPELEEVTESMTAEEKLKVYERNKERLENQGLKNLSGILDSIMVEHPKETLEVMALCCFVEPENVDDYPMEDYFEAGASLMNNKAVISFFTSLLSLVQTFTSSVSEA